MKKKSIILLSVILLLSISWLYFGYKFEKIIQNKYIPMLEQYSAKISAKSIEINKYTFTVTLNGVKLSPSSKLTPFYSDKIIIKNIPFSRTYSIHSFGKKGEISDIKDIIYAPEHKISVILSNPFFNRNSTDLSVKILYDRFKLYDSNTNEELLSFDSCEEKLIHKTHTDLDYILDIESIIKNTKQARHFQEFFISELVKIIPESFVNIKNQFKKWKNQESLFKMTELYGGVDRVIKIKLLYPKELLGQTISFLKNPKTEQFNLIGSTIVGKNFSLNINDQNKSDLYSNAYILDISNDKDAKLRFVGNTKYNYSDQQKAHLIDLLSDYIQEVTNKDFQKYIKNQETSVVFVQEDFTEAIKPLFNIKDINLNLDINASKSTGAISHLFNIKIDNFVSEFKGDYKKALYNAELKMSDPKTLTTNLTDYIEKAWIPIVQKTREVDYESFLKLILSDIKLNGMNTLDALNKQGNLKDKDDFLIDLGFSVEKGIKINNKSLDELLSDSRIKNFINFLKNDDLTKNNSLSESFDN